MLGPAIGGVAVASFIPLGQILLVDVATYAISACCIGAVSISSAHSAIAQQHHFTVRALCRDIAAHWQEVVAHRSLWITLVFSALCILLVGGALRLLIPAFMRTQHFADSQIGYALSLMALGTMLGALLCGKMMQDCSTRAVMQYWCGYGLTLILLPLCSAYQIAFLMMCLALGFVGAAVDLATIINIQQLSTEDNRGKNFGLFSTLANTGEALSSTLASVLAFMTSLGLCLALVGVAIAIIALVGRRQVSLRPPME
jgi:MFS transporter, DHA3 family, macrolide efflux protein